MRAHEMTRRKSLRAFSELLIQKIIQDLVQELVSKNYLSNTRYAEAYILSRARKGYGPNYIKQALRQAGLSQDLIHEVLEKLESLYFSFSNLTVKVLIFCLEFNFKTKIC